MNPATEPHGFAARARAGKFLGEIESAPFQVFETLEDAGTNLLAAGGGLIYQVVRELFSSELGDEPPVVYGKISVGVAVALVRPGEPTRAITNKDHALVHETRQTIKAMQLNHGYMAQKIEKLEKELVAAQWWEAE